MREEPHEKGKTASVRLLLGGLITAGLVLAWMRYGAVLGNRPQDLAHADASTARMAPSAARGELTAPERLTVDIFRRSAPSVVNITTVAVREDILRRNVMEIPRGTGSGFLWDDRGHVVTNFHVIQGASAARVALADHSSWEASLVGYAADKDLAVLRIKAPKEKLKPLRIGESQNLLVGQSVFAIGNPFGFDQTLSTGVISGLKREIMSVVRRPIQDVIQTDAAINPGNSGGPLIDSAGRLIGVNTAIYSPSGAYAGIGFAVPVDTVRRIVPQLIEFGKVTRPGLGVQIADQELAQRLRIPGALVLGVVPGSPASRSGIRPTRRDPNSGAVVLGDIIVGIDNEKVDTPNDVYRLLDKREVGQTVRLKLKRGEREEQLQIKLAPFED